MSKTVLTRVRYGSKVRVMNKYPLIGSLSTVLKADWLLIRSSA